MGYCDYHNSEKSGPMNGWYCNQMDKYVDRSLYTHYCNNSIRCKYCPALGGDDRDRKPRVEETEKPVEKSYSRRNTDVEDDRGTTGGVSRGGGGSTPGFFETAGAVIKTLGLALIVSAIICVLVFGADFLGFLGPWVDFQLPADSPLIQDASLYSVSWDADTRFEGRSEEFDKEGLAHARFHNGVSDVYYYQDRAAVWIGTCNLMTLNTAVVYDITEDEIQSQLFRTLLIHLTDSQDVPIMSEPAVTLDSGESLDVQYMGDDLWIVILPNDQLNPSLNLASDGYKPVTFSVDMKERVAEVNVKMAAKEG